ncbi:MAG: tryptophan 7-halogenase, partial [Myxococcota bacterium]|nr:tryptophan 7-halogenase [Myxococcota bacterium]
MKHVDVAIFGGGPAGALTAALLCRQNPGIRVAVLEKERFPRHHVGEVTLPGWAAILERAGALEALDAQTPIKKLGVIFSWGPKEAGEIWTADFRERATGRPAPGSWHV